MATLLLILIFSSKMVFSFNNKYYFRFKWFSRKNGLHIYHVLQWLFPRQRQKVHRLFINLFPLNSVCWGSLTRAANTNSELRSVLLLTSVTVRWWLFSAVSWLRDTVPSPSSMLPSYKISQVPAEALASSQKNEWRSRVPSLVDIQGSRHSLGLWHIVSWSCLRLASSSMPGVCLFEFSEKEGNRKVR